MFQFFPWTNDHQLNLDWILQFLKKLPWTVNGQEADPETHNINLPGWAGGVLPISDGGTGMNDEKLFNTPDEIAVAHEDFQLVNARAVVWGKVSALLIQIKALTNITTGSWHTVASILDPFAPGWNMSINVMHTEVNAIAQITGNGDLQIKTSNEIPANSTITFEGLIMVR